MDLKNKFLVVVLVKYIISKIKISVQRHLSFIFTVFFEYSMQTQTYLQRKTYIYESTNGLIFSW